MGKMLHRAEGQEKSVEKEMIEDDRKPTEDSFLIEERQLSEEYDRKPEAGDNGFKGEGEEQSKAESVTSEEGKGKKTEENGRKREIET